MGRIEREKKIVSLMIRLYCKKKEGHRELCESCRALEAYALARLERCPFGEKKTACQSCKVHCYNPKMRAKIKEVMRFSGPRMILMAPGEALRHLLATLSDKIRRR
ncbi:MAG: nitrous oxide-stimulated promoter family protein [Porphyromonas sp.]|nr:nitrous oxide-stimulated promoter family protein [Bacteroidales bacterium]MDY3101078.1 nitrous oxide-stimulated promoter family protein [Porphyromonas sp.]